MTVPVFLALPSTLHEPLFEDLCGVLDGQRVVLKGSEARHALSVKRICPGELVDLVDGRGLRLRAKASASSLRGFFEVEVLSVVQEPVFFPSFTLVQALAKNRRDEQAVESATEIGVSEVIPWQADRCVAVWRGGKTDKSLRGLEKWENLVRSAVKQCRGAFLPEVRPLVDTAALCELVGQRVADGERVFVLHECASELLSEQLDALGCVSRGDCGLSRVTVIVGPEGGISREEIEALFSAGAQVLRLGRAILRSSTAGPAALAVISAACGKWDLPALGD